MNPRDFLTSARRLLLSADEADWRSAASRAYYAVFHVGSELMTALGFTVPNSDRAHAYLWLRLQNCGDPVLVKSGAKASDLRRARNKADYDLRRSLFQAEARTYVHEAGVIIQILDSVVEPTRSQIITAMKDYERNVLRDVTWHP